MMSDERFEKLEMKAAFQEELIQQLDDVLISQQQQITKLEQELKLLRSEFKTIENQLPDDGPEAPPPHY